MNGNDNVVIYTQNEKAKRSILKFILDYLGITVTLTEESIEIHGAISNDIINNIIKKVIIEQQMEVVTIKPENNQEKTIEQGVQSERKVEKYEETAEKAQPPNNEQRKTQENVTINKKQKGPTLKEIVYNFICEKQQVTNAQIIENCQIGCQYTSRILNILSDEGKIEKVERGKWRLKKEEGEEKLEENTIKSSESTKEKAEIKVREDNPFESLNDSEKQIYNFIKERKNVGFIEIVEKFKLERSKVANILQKLKRRDLVAHGSHGYWITVKTKEEKVLDLLANGWRMSEEEISIKTGIDIKEVTTIIKKLLKEEKIKPIEEDYRIREDLFGVFKQEKYKVLLDYIMSISRFSIGRIRCKYPEEFHKLDELIQQLTPKYICEEKDSPGAYTVYKKGIVLYYIMNHKNVTFSAIKANLNMLSSREILNVIDIAIKEGKLEKNANGGYKIIKML